MPFALPIDSAEDASGPRWRVSPFGYSRINACSRLPETFRSDPRPSSALGAKASTVSPCSFLRDTENTILFLSLVSHLSQHFFINGYFRCAFASLFLHPYLLVKVRTRFLASWRPLTGLFHHPPFFCRRGRTPVNVFGFIDKPARLTAGLVHLPADCLRIQLSVDRKSLQTLLLNNSSL